MRCTVGSPSWCGDCVLTQHPASAFIMLIVLRSGWMTLGNFSVPQFPHLGNDSNNSTCLRIVLKIKGGNV